MSLEPLPDSTGSVAPDPAVTGDVVRDGDQAAVQRRIDGERAALGRTVEELAARLDWKAQLRRRVAQATQGVGATAQRVVGATGVPALGSAARRAWARLRRST